MMDTFFSDRLRIIDANINRIGEGLRVLEEFARLALNNGVLTRRLKSLRHEILHIDTGLQLQLLQARDAVGDVGAGKLTLEGSEREGAVETIIANSRRVQESLRVMEELSKEPGLSASSRDYEKARFTVYTIEKELVARILRQDKTKRLTGLYAIVDTEFLRGRDCIDVAKEIIGGGGKIIQLRDKKSDTRDFLANAIRLRRYCAEKEALFIVNDSLAVALAAEADGLHVGQEDLPAAMARKLLPIDKILGVSTRTVEQARNAVVDGADYVGVGAIYTTATKADSPAQGTEIIEETKRAISIPVVAIGGINENNLGEVTQAGADAAAVISAIMGAADTLAATHRLVSIIEGGKSEKPR
jgi:thiamine-phosphate pyrophosphorylase